MNASTVSRRVARLEDKLGVTLFERGRFGIRLTPAGKAILVHARRALDDVDALAAAGQCNGRGMVGGIRLGVRLPPVGKTMRSLLADWREFCPEVALVLIELNDDELQLALAERTIDAAILPKHARRPGSAAIAMWSERLYAAVAETHALAVGPSVRWFDLHREVILTQEWEGSHVGREFFASLMGGAASFAAHASSKQSILALVAAGHGITLAAASQAEVSIPGVVFRPIAEENAVFHLELAWAPEIESPVLGRFIAFVRDRPRDEGTS